MWFIAEIYSADKSVIDTMHHYNWHLLWDSAIVKHGTTVDFTIFDRDGYKIADYKKGRT